MSKESILNEHLLKALVSSSGSLWIEKLYPEMAQHHILRHDDGTPMLEITSQHIGAFKEPIHISCPIVSEEDCEKFIKNVRNILDQFHTDAILNGIRLTAPDYIELDSFAAFNCADVNSHRGFNRGRLTPIEHATSGALSTKHFSHLIRGPIMFDETLVPGDPVQISYEAVGGLSKKKNKRIKPTLDNLQTRNQVRKDAAAKFMEKSLRKAEIKKAEADWADPNYDPFAV